MSERKLLLYLGMMGNPETGEEEEEEEKARHWTQIDVIKKWSLSSRGGWGD